MDHQWYSKSRNLVENAIINPWTVGTGFLRKMYVNNIIKLYHYLYEKKYSRVSNKRTKVIKVSRSQNTPKLINVPDQITVPESKIHKTNKRTRIQ